MDLKKLFSGIAVSTLAVAGLASASNFSDTQGHWAETGGYIDAAIAEGAIDGTKSTFRPDDNITRAELTKMVSVYDLGGDEPTAMDYLSDAGFSDVPADAWYYDTVNYAAEEGIVGGYSDGTFRPGVAMNRAEAVKVITLALEVPSVDVTLPFSDVSENDWFYPFVKNAYGNCVVKGRTATQFAPAANITRAEAVKVFVASVNPSCGEAVTPTPEVTVTPTPTGETTTPTPAVTTDATSEVVLSSMSPAAQSVPQNAYQVPFLAIDVTASNDEDLLLTGLTLQHTGLGDADSVVNIQAFEGVIPRGNEKDFSGEDDIATLNLQSDPIVVPAGTTKTVYIRADINATGETAGEHALALLSSDSVSLIGSDTNAAVPTTGTFPIVGSTMSIADIEVGSVSIEYDTIEDRVVEAGTADVELADIRFRETSGTEDVYARALTVELRGDLDDGDIENFYVVVDGVRVSNVVATSTNDFVTFDLTAVNAEGVLIEDSSNESFSVRGDLTGPIDSFSDADATSADVYVAVDSTSDVVITGAKYGFGVNRSIAQSEKDEVSSATNAFTANAGVVVTGGDITFSLESEATDIAEDTDDVIFGTLTIENMAEAIEIDGDTFDFYVTSNNASTKDGNDGVNILENIRVVSAVNDSTVLGSVDVNLTADLAADGYVQLADLADDLYVGAGQTVTYYIVADVKDNLTNLEGTTVKFTLAGNASQTEGLDTITVTGQTSDETTGFDIKPSGTLSTKTYTLQEAGIVVTKKALQSDTYVASTDGAVVWNGTVRADNVKDIELDRLVFTYAGTAGTSDLNNFGLQALVDGNWENVDTGVSVNSPFTFSDLDELTAGDFVVEAGEEVEVRVIADIADTVNDGSTIYVVLDSVEFQEVESDGSLGTSTTKTYGTAQYTAVTFTLVDNGSLTVSLDSADTPNTANLIAGTTLNDVAIYKVKADDEDVAIDDVTVTVEDGTLAGITTVVATPAPTAALTQTAKEATVNTSIVELGTGTNLVEGTTIKVALQPNTTSATELTIPAGTIEEKLEAIADQINFDYTTATLVNDSGVYCDIDTDTTTAACDGGTAVDAVASRSASQIVIADTTAVQFTQGSSPALSGTTAGSFTVVQEFRSDPAVQGTASLTLGGSVYTGDVLTATVISTGTSGTPVTDIQVVYTAPQVDHDDDAGTADIDAAVAIEDVLADIAEAINSNADSASGDSVLTNPTAAVGGDDISATVSGNTILLVGKTDGTTLTAAPTFVTTITASPRGGSVSDAKDAVSSVSLYHETTLLDTVTLNTDGKAVFEDLNWIVLAGETEDITVKVNLNEIGTNSSDTAESGHVFKTTLTVDEAKGEDSGEILTVTQPINSTALFAVTNNKLQIAKSTQSTTLSGTTADLLKFKVFDASDDGDNARLTSLEFDITSTGVTEFLVDTNPNDTFSLAGGNATWSCSSDASANDTDAVVTCTTTGVEEVSASGTVFVLKLENVDLPSSTGDDSITAKLVINSTVPGGSEGVDWVDGGDGASATADGATVNWIDFGEADETTSYILNTVSN